MVEGKKFIKIMFCLAYRFFSLERIGQVRLGYIVQQEVFSMVSNKLQIKKYVIYLCSKQTIN